MSLYTSDVFYRLYFTTFIVCIFAMFTVSICTGEVSHVGL